MAIQLDEIYSVAGACEATGFGETFLRGQIKTGRLKARPFGARLLKIKGQDLAEWFDAQPLLSEITPSSKEDENTDGKSAGKRTAADGALISAFR